MHDRKVTESFEALKELKSWIFKTSDGFNLIERLKQWLAVINTFVCQYKKVFNWSLGVVERVRGDVSRHKVYKKV